MKNMISTTHLLFQGRFQISFQLQECTRLHVVAWPGCLSRARRCRCGFETCGILHQVKLSGAWAYTLRWLFQYTLLLECCHDIPGGSTDPLCRASQERGEVGWILTSATSVASRQGVCEVCRDLLSQILNTITNGSHSEFFSIITVYSH